MPDAAGVVDHIVTEGLVCADFSAVVDLAVVVVSVVVFGGCLVVGNGVVKGAKLNRSYSSTTTSCEQAWIGFSSISGVSLATKHIRSKNDTLC